MVGAFVHCPSHSHIAQQSISSGEGNGNFSYVDGVKKAAAKTPSDIDLRPGNPSHRNPRAEALVAKAGADSKQHGRGAEASPVQWGLANEGKSMSEIKPMSEPSQCSSWTST